VIEGSPCSDWFRRHTRGGGVHMVHNPPSPNICLVAEVRVLSRLNREMLFDHHYCANQADGSKVIFICRRFPGFCVELWRLSSWCSSICILCTQPINALEAVSFIGITLGTMVQRSCTASKTSHQPNSEECRSRGWLCPVCDRAITCLLCLDTCIKNDLAALS
jgi:hypothetical protein